MKIFISGTDTDVGKTLISSWIALHTGFAYFKPIQTGLEQGTDSAEVRKLAGTKIYPECFTYQAPVSPHLAAKMEQRPIDLQKIVLPPENHLIVEGAGGLLVPLNDQNFLIDLIKQLDIPVILVTRTLLGTINHTLLHLEALRNRDIIVKGVIMNGTCNIENKRAIEFYGQTCVVAEFPKLDIVDHHTLKMIPLPEKLNHILKAYYL